MPVGADGRIHTTFGHDPSTLRLCSKYPNLQNIPRGGTEAQKWVKDIFLAPEGFTFLEADFSALEAVLVGYFANYPLYYRFAKMGVHAYLAATLVGEEVDLSLSDDEIKKIFSRVKKSNKDMYDTAKRVVHGSNYLMTPRKMWEEYPETFPTIAAAKERQDGYFELFPGIRKWQFSLCEQVDATKKRKVEEEDNRIITPWTIGNSTVQNPFGYLHRFHHVLDWTLIEGEWFSSFGEDAKRLVAFLPQSTGSGIIKRATREIASRYPEIGDMMRLLVHDSIILEVPEDEADEIARIVAGVMNEPIPELPLDPVWGFGDHVTIGVEVKKGRRWSEMAEILKL